MCESQIGLFERFVHPKAALISIFCNNTGILRTLYVIGQRCRILDYIQLEVFLLYPNVSQGARTELYLDTSKR